MPTPNGCYCSSTQLDLLTAILQRDRATFDRLAQLIQAFGGSATGGRADTSDCFCSDSKWDLLVRILEQRQSNFNRLQEVIAAV